MSKKKKLKIAQIVSMEESVPPQGRNGLEFVVSWLTEGLVKKGHKVSLFAPASSKTKANLISIFNTGTSKKPYKVFDWNNKNFSDWNSALAASKQKEFDIIHSHTGTIAQYVPFINKPVVQTLHGPCYKDFKEKYLQNKKKAGYFKFALNNMAKINYVCVSQNQEKQYTTYSKYYFKKHTAIHNGIPVVNFDYKEKSGEYLLYIGYINAQKGADTAVQVAKKLDMNLILAGDIFGQEDFFNKKIKPFLSRKINYIGPVSFKEKNKLYKNALATLAPISWDEPFGLILAESQACGTPVIAFDRGASKEIIKNNKTGFMVKDLAQMTKAIKKVKQIKREECRKNIEQNFSVERMVDDYEKLFYKLNK